MLQHNHVSKLLSTAATGNGVLDDVDSVGLLTPIKDTDQRLQHEPSSPQQDNVSTSSKERTERNLWRNDEVMEMMFVMQQIKALDKLNDKQMKSENVFKDVETIMRRNGFVKKSHLQIWTKWKFLKSTYMTSRRNGVVPRMIPPDIYGELHQMISGTSEYDTSPTGSVNGDNSGEKSDTISNAETDDKLGVAHPVFGFHLGLVKNEPIDTGYDTIGNNETTAEKNKLEEKVSTVQASIHKPKPEKEKHRETEEVVPHRGRGRPPKKLPWVTPLLNSNSISTTELSKPNLPPLRVAPFAKVAHATNALAISRPPPPLTMPPISRPIRVTNISNINANNKGELRHLRLIQQKQLPKPQILSSQRQNLQNVRLQKGVSTQSGRASDTPSPSYPKLKQVPIRKTPYCLRPDRAIPDLNESFSPPPMAEKQRKVEEVPSTTHLVMQSQEKDNLRKRRFDEQHTQPKMRKFHRSIEELQTADGEQSPAVERSHGKLMQMAIVELSASLRKTQTQMLNEFFRKQHELVEMEHAFQMQQDRLIMETFQVQTKEVMNSVRDLVATLASARAKQQLSRASKIPDKCRTCQLRPKTISTFVNEASEQELQALLQHHLNGHATESELEIVNDIQHQKQQETSERYTDDEEQNVSFDEEIHNVLQAVDCNAQDGNDHDPSQPSSPFFQRLLQTNSCGNDVGDCNVNKNDDYVEDDGDSGSDVDDGDDEISQTVNDNTADLDHLQSNNASLESV